MHSKLFNYIKNQYIMGNFSDDELAILVTRGHITDAERLELLSLKVSS